MFINKVEWVDGYLKQILGDDYVSHEWYQNTIRIYASKNGYAKISALKEEIVLGLAVRFPDVRIMFHRASFTAQQ